MEAINNIPQPTAAQKWIPVIARDACVGCNRCVLACEPGCIELIWDFATLTGAEKCGSCGRCEDACPHEVIKMDWRAVVGPSAVGLWREAPAPVVPAPAFLQRWHAKFFS